MSQTITAENLALRPLDDAARWDEFVERADGGTFCHLSAWREVVREAYGYEPLYRVGVDDEGAWRGVLPLVRVRSRLTGQHLLSMPLLNYGGPLGTPAARVALAEAAVAEAKRSGADRLQLRNRVPVDVPVLRDSDDKVTVLLELPETADELWDDVFRSKLRGKIRRPMKEGMETHFGPEQFDAFYSIFRRNMRDLGTPVHARRLFTSICDHFSEHVIFGAVYWKGEPVAGGCGFIWQDEFEMNWASSLREHNRMKPNMLLYWSFMAEVIERGARIFNFGRCTPGGGTHRFKQGWRGDDVPLAWLEWTPRSAHASSSSEASHVRFASAAWQRLPLVVANRLGPVVARRLPWW